MYQIVKRSLLGKNYFDIIVSKEPITMKLLKKKNGVTGDLPKCTFRFTQKSIPYYFFLDNVNPTFLLLGMKQFAFQKCGQQALYRCDFSIPWPGSVLRQFYLLHLGTDAATRYY